MGLDIDINRCERRLFENKAALFNGTRVVDCGNLENEDTELLVEYRNDYAIRAVLILVTKVRSQCDDVELTDDSIARAIYLCTDPEYDMDPDEAMRLHEHLVQIRAETNFSTHAVYFSWS